MYRGYYLAANGIINQQRIMNITANNIANSQTAGFKADNPIPTTFDERLLLIRNKNNTSGTIEYRTLDHSDTDLTQGSFEYTGRRLDAAISGNVYFNIIPASQTLYGEDGVNPAGAETLLTRNGQFNIDDEGYLALGSAGRVMGQGGPIQIGTADFSIDDKGNIQTDDGREFKLRLTVVESTEDVLKKGDNMFFAENARDAADTDNYTVIQGAYERSNVDAAKEMTRAIAAQRLYDACSQALKQIDTVNQRTAQLSKI